jgi:3-hydroxyacyl-[acyl-carrier-protein] dehydratase
MDPIRDRIPHREPFLLVDRIVEQEPERIVTEWDLDPGLPFFAGHYPGQPIVPGVLICESAVQAGALLCAARPGDETPVGSVPVLTRVTDARFRRMVRPGQTLRFEVVLDERLGPARYLTARVTSDGASVARVAFVVSVASLPAEAAPGAPSARGA